MLGSQCSVKALPVIPRQKAEMATSTSAPEESRPPLAFSYFWVLKLQWHASESKLRVGMKWSGGLTDQWKTLETSPFA